MPVWHLQDDRGAPVEVRLEGKCPCSLGSLGSVLPHHTTESECFQYKLKDMFKNCLFEPQRLSLLSKFFQRFWLQKRFTNAHLGWRQAWKPWGQKNHGLAGLLGGSSTVLQRTSVFILLHLEAKGWSVMQSYTYWLYRVIFVRVAPDGWKEIPTEAASTRQR